MASTIRLIAGFVVAVLGGGTGEPLSVLVKTASYWSPFRVIGALSMDSVLVVVVGVGLVVTTLYSEPEIATNPLPLLTIQTTVGAGLPLAVAENDSVLPSLMVTELLFAMGTGLPLVFVIIVGAKSTVKVAAELVTLPDELANMASYSKPFIPAEAFITVSIDVVVPAEVFVVTLMLLPGKISENEAPPLVLTSQTTDIGEPVAEAVKVAVLVGAFTVTLVGFPPRVIFGGLFTVTVNVAGADVAVDGGGTGEPLSVLVNTASYSSWFIADVTPVSVNTLVVVLTPGGIVLVVDTLKPEPERGLNVAPLSELTSHCTVGLG
jgi:hypothetical protein